MDITADQLLFLEVISRGDVPPLLKLPLEIRKLKFDFVRARLKKINKGPTPFLVTFPLRIEPEKGSPKPNQNTALFWGIVGECAINRHLRLKADWERLVETISFDHDVLEVGQVVLCRSKQQRLSPSKKILECQKDLDSSEAPDGIAESETNIFRAVILTKAPLQVFALDNGYFKRVTMKMLFCPVIEELQPAEQPLFSTVAAPFVSLVEVELVEDEDDINDDLGENKCSKVPVKMIEEENRTEFSISPVIVKENNGSFSEERLDVAATARSIHAFDYGASVEEKPDTDLRSESTIDHILLGSESVSEDIVRFLNSQTKGSVVFGILGMPKTSVGIAIQPVDFLVVERRIRDAIGTQLGDEGEFVQSLLSFRFIEVVGESLDGPIPSRHRHVMFLDVAGSVNEKIFCFRRFYPWRQLTSNNDVYKRNLFSEAGVVYERAENRRKIDHGGRLTGKRNTENVTTQVLFDPQFFMGDECPFVEDQTTQISPEIFPASMSLNDLARDISAMYNASVGGSIFFGFSGSTYELRTSGIKILSPSISSFERIVHDAVSSMKPNSPVFPARVFLHAIYERESSSEITPIRDKFVIEIRVAPRHDLEFFSVMFRETADVRPHRGLVAFDVRTGKMVGQRSFYLRLGTEVREVSVNEIRKRAFEDLLDRWRSATKLGKDLLAKK